MRSPGTDTIKLLTILSRWGHTVLRTWACCCLLLPGRAIKPFFSTSPTTLRFNSVSGVQGWVWLQMGTGWRGLIERHIAFMSTLENRHDILEVSRNVVLGWAQIVGLYGSYQLEVALPVKSWRRFAPMPIPLLLKSKLLPTNFYKFGSLGFHGHLWLSNFFLLMTCLSLMNFTLFYAKPRRKAKLVCLQFSSPFLLQKINTFWS